MKITLFKDGMCKRTKSAALIDILKNDGWIVDGEIAVAVVNKAPTLRPSTREEAFSLTNNQIRAFMTECGIKHTPLMNKEKLIDVWFSSVEPQ